MYRTVAACLREFYATHRRPPTPEELFNVAWPQFAEHTDWQRPPERRPDQMMQKCSYALARQARGDIPGMRNVEEAIETHRARVAAPRQNTSCNGPLPPGVQLEDFYGYMVEHKYIFTPTGQVWPASSVDGRIPKEGR